MARLIAEGTLEELHRRTGKAATSLEDTFLTLVAEPGREPREPARHIGLARQPRASARLARLARDDDGGPPRAHAQRCDRADRLCRLHASAGLFDGRPLRRAGIGPDKATLVVVTGTMLLSWSLLVSQAMELVTRAFYSRSDLDLILTSPVRPRKIFSRAHRPRRCRSCAVRDAAGDAFHQRAGGSRRRAMARRLWRGRRHGCGSDGCCGGAHGGAVSHHRRQAHAADRADRGGGDRRRLRHRTADRGDLCRTAACRLRRCNRPG